MATYQTSGVITAVGITAAIQAGSQGPQINVGGFQIGSNSAAQGAVAQTTDTSITPLVYTGTVAQMTYSQVNADTIVWRIRLDTTVGDFNIGTVGLILEDGTLFCEAVLPGQAYKYQSSSPGTVGNVEYVNVLMRLANVGNLINLTLIESLDCNLPEVPTELQLPPANATVFDTYLVDNHTHVGVPALSVRLNELWWHAPHRACPGQGQGVIVVTAGAFATTVTPAGLAPAPALGPVAFDPATRLFVAADGGSDTMFAVGIRTSAFEITTLGTVVGTLAGLSGQLTPETAYYADTGVNVGLLTTTPTGAALLAATSATDVYVDTTGAFLDAVSGEGDQGDAEVEADLLALIAHEARQRIRNERAARRTAERLFATA